MKTFRITIERRTIDYAEIEIEAEDENKAYEEVDNMAFSDALFADGGEAQYEVQAVEELEDDLEEEDLDDEDFEEEESEEDELPLSGRLCDEDGNLWDEDEE